MKRVFLESAWLNKFNFKFGTLDQFQIQQSFGFGANSQSSIFGQKFESRTHSIRVSTAIQLVLLGVQKNEGKNTIEIFAHEINATLIVQMDQRLAITVGQVVKIIIQICGMLTKRMGCIPFRSSTIANL
ncbi:hypothetical protein BpHYR1_019250 [Brachionus plicatilis]|uniref:Uncharacterized protein n=1 Tax=Brachionus plicatilis TaxID=10195 RepID=A0A3M7PEG9_BRAPC|nr:hypothetical protein BpHYR1_019250 [Brachionus plicatilis]